MFQSDEKLTIVFDFSASFDLTHSACRNSNDASTFTLCNLTSNYIALLGKKKINKEKQLQTYR